MEKRQDKTKKFLTANEACQRLGIPLSTLYRLSRNNIIKSMHIGYRWYYPETEIEKYLSCIPSRGIYPERADEPKERRNYPRMNCSIESYYSVDLPEKNISVNKAVIKNICAGGLLLQDEYNIDDIKLEDPVNLEFRIKTDNKETVIKTNGRIVRKTDDKCGIKFRNIDKESQNLITQFVG